MAARLVLVDGSSYIYRAFHALPALTTTKGEPSGAVYGVVAMLKKLQAEFAEDKLVVVLDSPTPTFRHELYPAYKANRLKMPEELQAQIPALHALIPAMGIPLILHPGVEADDIIATLARSAEKKGLMTIISTNDKDFAQLVTPKIHLVNTVSGMVLDSQGVVDRFNVYPHQIIDYLALIGDTSDNVPGVPLVGPKTAAKWLKQYETIEQLLKHLDQIPGKAGANLKAHQDQLALAKTLITIKEDVPLKESVDALLSYHPTKDYLILAHWFEKLEFKQWRAALINEKPIPRRDYTQHELITDQSVLTTWVSSMQAASYIAIDIETTSLNTLDAEIVGIGLGVSLDKIAYIPLQHDEGEGMQLNVKDVLEQLKPLLEDDHLKKIGHNLKYDQGVLANYNINLKGLYADTLLEAYLLDSTQKHNDLDTLSEKHLSYQTITFEAIAGKGKKALSFNQIPIEKAAPYAAEDIGVCLALHQKLEPQLIQAGGITIRDAIEMPLIPVLSDMERRGVRVNQALLNRQSQELAQRLTEIENETYQLAGETFNLGSPKQLQAILYDKHQLPILARTSTGQPSTAEVVLQALAVDHPLPKLLVEYRTLSKLKSTYTDALPKQIHPKTQRVHTAYHQAVVATGRLSSSNPNLQNIPIRTEEGRRIRFAFEATPGYQLLAADYSQIELRIMAHFSEDEGLLDALHQEQDVHSATAARLFGVSIEAVTNEQRRRAKAINFGLMYGMSAFGLATQLKTTPEAAKTIIGEYFDRYPGVQRYMEKTRQLVHSQGYVSTLFGRRLYLPSINSPNKRFQKAAERAAINAPLQGTAADIIKRAMIHIDTTLKEKKIEAAMIMQVHDELVFEIKEETLAVAKACIIEGMQNAASLHVPLRVAVGVGSNWGAAH